MAKGKSSGRHVTLRHSLPSFRRPRNTDFPRNHLALLTSLLPSLASLVWKIASHSSDPRALYSRSPVVRDQSRILGQWGIGGSAGKCGERDFTLIDEVSSRVARIGLMKRASRRQGDVGASCTPHSSPLSSPYRKRGSSRTHSPYITASPPFCVEKPIGLMDPTHYVTFCCTCVNLRGPAAAWTCLNEL